LIDTKEQLKYVDILITPDLRDVSSGDFNKSHIIEMAGETAARAQYNKLKALADSLGKYGQRPVPHPLPERDSILITRVVVNDLKYNDKALAFGKLNISGNSYITHEEMEAAIDRLFGTLYFDKLTYRFEKDGAGFRLLVDAKEKPPSALKVAVHYDNFYGAGMLLHYSKSNFLFTGAKLSITADLSEYPQGRLYFRKYTGKRKNILTSIESIYESSLIPGYLQGQEVGYFKQNHFTSETALKRGITLNQQAGFGVLFEYSAVYPNKSMQTLYPEIYNFKRYGFYGFGLSGIYGLNTLDDLLYPTEGTLLNLYVKGIYKPGLDLKYLVDTIKTETTLNSFGKLLFQADHYMPAGPKLILNTGLSVGLSTNEFIASDYFFAGGYKYNLRRNYIPFLGYHPGEVVATNFLEMKFGLQVQLLKNLRAEASFNGMMVSVSPEDLTNDIFSLNPDAWHMGYGIGVTYKTPLGPVSVCIADNNRDSLARWYINLGFTF
jgi:outer membrane protein assembly factor BamA